MTIGMICPTTPKLSTVTERCLKTKSTNLHYTPQWHIHVVGSSGSFLVNQFVSFLNLDFIVQYERIVVTVGAMIETTFIISLFFE